MKKLTNKPSRPQKLELKRETIVELTDYRLGKVVGGSGQSVCLGCQTTSLETQWG
jgi:hypothetical protein